jgi:hypothetical protein
MGLLTNVVDGLVDLLIPQQEGGVTVALRDAPHTGGVMELTEEEILVIRERLEAIKEAFVPDEYTSYADTFYLVATYNREYPDEVINGDTCQYVMSYKTEEEKAAENEGYETIEPPVE